MLEQPVAFAIIIFSPNKVVASFIYGVSPQPAQAPLNWNKGFSNWLPFVVNFEKIVLSFSTFSLKA